MSAPTEALAAVESAPAAPESAPIAESAPVEAESAPEPTTDAPEPAESAPSGDESAPVTTESAPAAAESSPEPTSESEWVGELASLQSAEWFKGLPDASKNAILAGIETKYKNWQSGYTKKFQDLANQRDQLQTDRQKLRREEIRVQKWLYGTEDPLAAKQAEMDQLTQKHTEAVAALEKAHTEALQAAQTNQGTEFDEAKQALEKAQAQVQQFEAAQAERDKVELESAADEFMGYVKTNAPDIMDNDAMYFDLIGACRVGNSLDDAIHMVRAKYNRGKPQPEAVPAAMDMMNMGTGQTAGTETGETRSFDQIMDSMRREAQRQGFASGE
jgi:hypothetical protein